MKAVIAITFLFCQLNCMAQNVKETTRAARKNDSLQLSGMMSISRIGFSPVPSFSFDGPIASAFLTIAKAKINYEPGVFWGLNGKPWIIDNWLKYRLLNTASIQLRAGINPGIFFKSELIDEKNEIIKANRNITMGLFGNYKITRLLSLRFTYWYNKRFDSGTLSGHFLDVTGLFPDIQAAKKITVNIKPELFYFNNAGPVDGLFSAAGITIAHIKCPVSLYLQCVEKLWTNFIADDFKWNAGITWKF